MKLNADLIRRDVARCKQVEWTPMAMAGVDRRMLGHNGREVALATSIKRYAPGERLSANNQTCVDECIIHDGAFQDGHGDYPVGTCVHNAPVSSCTPILKQGCTTCVMPEQCGTAGRPRIRVDRAAAFVGTAILPAEAFETIPVYRPAPIRTLTEAVPGGAKVPVLDRYRNECAGSQIKGGRSHLPKGTDVRALTEAEGADIWIKPGYPGHTRPPAAGR